MIPKAVLRTVIADQLNEIGQQGEEVVRSAFPSLKSYSGTSAYVVKGVRRCGKSTLLRQLIDAKFKDDFLYFNFDDERIVDFGSNDFQTLMEALIERFGDKKNAFFDEIQNVDGWELFVNRLLRQRYRVFITGSSANLLSKELGTHMTGRHVDMELYPFSFAEFLRAREFQKPEGRFLSTPERALISKAFEEYLHAGGMPEAVVSSNQNIVLQIVNDIIQKDILGRHSVRKPSELRSVLGFLISNSANPITYLSISNNFGIKSPDTVQKYIEYAEEAYLIFSIRKFDRKIKRLDKNPKKVYCVDNGMITKYAPGFAEKDGALLENLIAIHLKRLGKEAFYYKSRRGNEIDFVIPADKTAIQVCYELNGGNRERETEGLLDAMNEEKFDKAFVLTLDQEEEITLKNKKMIVMPAWRWLLASEPH